MIIYNYIVTNITNGKKYVGMHCSESMQDDYLGSGKAIKRAVQIYGRDNFIKEILCLCDDLQQAHLNESKYIEMYDTLSPNGYNLNTTGGLMCSGGLYSEESKSRISNALKGRKLTDEHKEKVRLANIGRECTWKDKISKANKGRVLTDEHKQKLSASHKEKPSHRLGCKHTEESKEKMRQASLGKPSAFKGKKHTEESNRKNAEAHKGRPAWNKGMPSNRQRNENGQFI